MHFTDLAIAASWMEYLATAKRLNEPTESLLSFRLQLAESLFTYVPPDATIPRAIGRPRATQVEDEEEEPSQSQKRPRYVPPLKLVRSDRYEHMPMFDDAKTP